MKVKTAAASLVCLAMITGCTGSKTPSDYSREYSEPKESETFKSGPVKATKTDTDTAASLKTKLSTGTVDKDGNLPITVTMTNSGKDVASADFYILGTVKTGDGEQKNQYLDAFQSEKDALDTQYTLFNNNSTNSDFSIDDDDSSNTLMRVTYINPGETKTYKMYLATESYDGISSVNDISDIHVKIDKIYTGQEKSELAGVEHISSKGEFTCSVKDKGSNWLMMFGSHTYEITIKNNTKRYIKDASVIIRFKDQANDGYAHVSDIKPGQMKKFTSTLDRGESPKVIGVIYRTSAQGGE